MDEKNERPLFQGIDEIERIYAPEELPPDDPERARVRAEGEDAIDGSVLEEPPEPAHEDLQIVHFSGVFRPPYLLEQRLVRNGGARTSHQFLQQAILGGRK